MMGYPIPANLDMALAYAGSGQTNQGERTLKMEKMNENVRGWLGFKDIKGTGPGLEIPIFYGAEADELMKRGHQGEEDQNDNS